MILCKSDDSWFLSTGVNKVEGICWLRCSRQMWHYGSFKPLPPAGDVVYGSVAIEKVKFFPVLKYRHAIVYPEFFRLESRHPILQCRLMGFDAYTAGYSNDQQIADGWVGVGSGDGATKWLHVDEIEKTEGPPPAGVF